MSFWKTAGRKLNFISSSNWALTSIAGLRTAIRAASISGVYISDSARFFSRSTVVEKSSSIFVVLSTLDFCLAIFVTFWSKVTRRTECESGLGYYWRSKGEGGIETIEGRLWKGNFYPTCSFQSEYRLACSNLTLSTLSWKASWVLTSKPSP